MHTHTHTHSPSLSLSPGHLKKVHVPETPTEALLCMQMTDTAYSQSMNKTLLLIFFSNANRTFSRDGSCNKYYLDMHPFEHMPAKKKAPFAAGFGTM